MKVRTTTDYSKFGLIEGNRPRNDSHVKRLVKSFEANHLPTAILVDKDMRVLDGQHRLAALSRLGRPVHYIVADATVEDVKMVNSAQKQWTINDIINSHAATGNWNYIDLKNDMSTLGVTLSVALSVAGQNAKNIRSGSLKYKSTKRHRDAMLHTQEITGFVGSRQNTATHAVAKLTTHPKYDHNRAVKNFKKFQGTDKLAPRVNVKAYLVMLEEIYNYDTRKSDKLIRLV
jgi:hypothetical protein